MTLCYLGLGSNLRTPQRQIRQALAQLRQLPKSTVIKVSSLYASHACGVRAQPSYCNAVVAIKTSLPPHFFLRVR